MPSSPSRAKSVPRTTNNSASSALDNQSTASSFFPSLPWHDSLLHRLGLEPQPPTLSPVVPPVPATIIPRLGVAATTTRTTASDSLRMRPPPPIPRTIQTNAAANLPWKTLPTSLITAADGPPVKRKRGRPRKHPLLHDGNSHVSSGAAASPVDEKSNPGRPQNQTPLVLENGSSNGDEALVAKRRTGRSRKHPLSEESAGTMEIPVEKRGPGRPRKHPLADEGSFGDRTLGSNVLTKRPLKKKRGPGRPRKHSLPDESVAPPTAEIAAVATTTTVESPKAVKKRGPGRPRKSALFAATASVAALVESPAKKKRGPGRPRKHPLSESRTTVHSTDADKSTADVFPAKKWGPVPRENPLPTDSPATQERRPGQPRNHRLPAESVVSTSATESISGSPVVESRTDGRISEDMTIPHSETNVDGGHSGAPLRPHTRDGSSAGRAHTIPVMVWEDHTSSSSDTTNRSSESTSASPSLSKPGLSAATRPKAANAGLEESRPSTSTAASSSEKTASGKTVPPLTMESETDSASRSTRALALLANTTRSVTTGGSAAHSTQGATSKIFHGINANEGEPVQNIVNEREGSVGSGTPKRKRGRPRKNSVTSDRLETPPKKKARPKQNQESTESPTKSSAPTKNRDRPRKQALSDEAMTTPELPLEPPKRKRGRPRKPAILASNTRKESPTSSSQTTSIVPVVPDRHALPISSTRGANAGSIVIHRQGDQATEEAIVTRELEIDLTDIVQEMNRAGSNRSNKVVLKLALVLSSPSR